MKIWILHTTAGGPGVGRHWRHFHFAQACLAQGHQVCIVTAANHHLMQGDEKPEGLKKIDGVAFWFIPSSSYSGNGWGRMLSMLLFGYKVELDAESIAHEVFTPNVVLASSPDLFKAPSAWRIAAKFKAHFWLEVRDLWPDSLIQLQQCSKSHPIVWWAKWIERKMYSKVDRLLCTLASAEPYFLERGLKVNRFRWVANGISQKEIDEAIEPSKVAHPLLEKINELHASQKKVIVYAGAMGPPNSLESIIDAAKFLQDKRSNIALLLVGAGISTTALKNKAIGLSNVIFHQEVSRDIVREILKLCDASIVKFHSLPMYDYGISPNKLCEYRLYSPRVLIACPKNALLQLADLYTFYLDADSSFELAIQMEKALATPHTDQVMRKKKVQKFSYDNLIQLALSDHV
jgi:glycosyltransferase involved in cell wall biosynthesis